MRVWLMDTSHYALEPRLCAGLNNTVRQVRGLLHKPKRTVEIKVAVHGAKMSKRWRLGKQLERQPMSGVVGIQQVTGEREQLAAVIGDPVFINGVVLVEPVADLGVRKRS